MLTFLKIWGTVSVNWLVLPSWVSNSLLRYCTVNIYPLYTSCTHNSRLKALGKAVPSLRLLEVLRPSRFFELYKKEIRKELPFVFPKLTQTWLTLLPNVPNVVNSTTVNQARAALRSCRVEATSGATSNTRRQFWLVERGWNIPICGVEFLRLPPLSRCANYPFSPLLLQNFLNRYQTCIWMLYFLSFKSCPTKIIRGAVRPRWSAIFRPFRNSWLFRSPGYLFRIHERTAADTSISSVAHS